MTWVLLIGVGWLLVALLVGVLIGRGIRLADRKEVDGSDVASPNFVVDVTLPAPAPAGAATPLVPEATAVEPAAPTDAPADVVATPERVRHPIPGARRPASRKASPHRSDLS